ncbi:MAG: hypothetical protein V1693_00865 [Nanoarchaeota archaeon]
MIRIFGNLDEMHLKGDEKIAYNILRIKEVAEGNLGKSLISLLSAVK